MPEEINVTNKLPDYNVQYTNTLENDGCYCFGIYRFAKVSNRLSASDENLFEEIMSYIEKNRTAEVMQLAQDLVDRNMSNELAWVAYAMAKEAWGDRELARKGYEQSIAINPRFAFALRNYGRFILGDNDAETAMMYFNRALENDPENAVFMAYVAYYLMFTESYAAAIDKCEYFISITDNNTYLKNTLGAIYVELSKTYIVDVPDDFEDPSAGTSPGFIYLSDINDVREYCTKAKELLTLEDFQADLDTCNDLLELCDKDQYETFRIRKWPYIIFHTLITVIFYGVISFITSGICLPLLIIATYANIKGSSFPMYMINNANYRGVEDPLKYKEGSIREAMAQGGANGWASSGGSELVLGFFQSRIWFFRARLAFYKRFIQNLKSKKKNSSNDAEPSDIQE